MWSCQPIQLRRLLDGYTISTVGEVFPFLHRDSGHGRVNGRESAVNERLKHVIGDIFNICKHTPNLAYVLMNALGNRATRQLHIEDRYTSKSDKQTLQLRHEGSLLTDLAPC